MTELASNPTEDLSTVKARLLHLLKEKRMSQTEFAKLMGVSPTYIGAMRRSLSEARLRRLLEIFPDLRRDWVLFGEGDMLEEPDEVIDLNDGYLVPLIPVKAFAGNLQHWSRGVELNDCEKVVSPVKGVDFAIRISGDSMEPEFQNGSILFIKRINDRAFIPWGNPMVIDTENGVLVKAVYPDNRQEKNGECIEARSYNPNYPPFQIPVECIYSLYRIITSVKQYTTL